MITQREWCFIVLWQEITSGCWDDIIWLKHVNILKCGVLTRLLLFLYLYLNLFFISSEYLFGVTKRYIFTCVWPTFWIYHFYTIISKFFCIKINFSTFMSWSIYFIAFRTIFVNIWEAIFYIFLFFKFIICLKSFTNLILFCVKKGNG